MGSLEALIKNYEDYIRLPIKPQLSGSERTIFVIYEPRDERRVRARLEEFAIATQNAGRKWRLVDITDSFSQWLAADPDRDAYFERPEWLTPLLPEYAGHVERAIGEIAEANNAPDSVVAILGAGALFPMARLSEVLAPATRSFAGQILVFFPGHRDATNYRLLDARDGFSYLAIPITG